MTNYTKYHADWQDGEAGGTPVTEAALDHIEEGLETAAAEITDHLADAAGAHAASAISSTDGTVQGDIDTLQTQTGTLLATITDHVLDGTDAHDASAISVAQPPFLTIGTPADAQSAVAALDYYLTAALTQHQGHLDDTSDAHDASAISTTGFSGALAGQTNVQGALAVLDAADLGSAAAADLAMRRARAAFARRTGAPIDIWIEGDSVTEGFYADAIGERWVDILRSNLRARYQPAGVAGGVGYCRIGGTTASGYSYKPWTTTGTMVETAGIGLWTAAVGSGGTTATLSFTGTAVDLVYGKWVGAGTVTVQVDGVTVDTFSANGAAEYGVVRRVASGLAATSHTMVVSATGDFSLEGAMVYNGDENAGVRIWPGGHSGFKAQDFANAAANAWDGALDTILPDIGIVWFGINDAVGGRSAAQYEADMRTIISRARAKAPNVHLVLPKLYSFTAISPTLAGQYGDAIDNIVADTANTSTVDLLSIMGQLTTGAQADLMDLLWTDQGHPSSYGHTLIADALTEHLLYGGGVAGGGAGATLLNDLTDVDTAGLSSGKVLTYNGTLWVPTAPASANGRGLVTRLTKSADQSFANGGTGVITWSAEERDEGSLASAGVITIPANGWIRAQAQVSVADATFMALAIRIAGTIKAQASFPIQAANAAWQIPVIGGWQPVTAGQVIDLYNAYAATSSTALVKGTADTWFEIEFIAS